jgi:hypothetical protein
MSVFQVAAGLESEPAANRRPTLARAFVNAAKNAVRIKNRIPGGPPVENGSQSEPFFSAS